MSVVFPVLVGLGGWTGIVLLILLVAIVFD